MPYTIQFNGLACFIKQADDSYLVALPDGRAATHPDTGKSLPRHDPFLVVIANDAKTENWPANLDGNGLAFLPIDPGATLAFQYANVSGTMDVTQYDTLKYSWSVLDPDFVIADKAKPKNTIAQMKLMQGLFRLYRIPKGDSLIAQVDVPLDPKQQFFQVTLKMNATTRTVTLPNDSEIVVANTSGGIGSKDDFFIYYQLNEGGKKTSGKTPSIRANAKLSNTRHPYLLRDKDLHVSCSPMNLP
jgi:hypothetical protein